MSTESRLEAHGRPVVPMVLGKPGSRDRVFHTLKHFFDSQEDWAAANGKSALSPLEALEALRAAGVGTGSIRERLTDARWWEAPRLELLLRAHDEGYYPRYASLAQRAGPFGERSSKWHHVGRGRLQAEVGRFVLVGELHADRFATISAYSSFVIRETRPPGAGSFPFAELLRGLQAAVEEESSHE